MAGGDPAGSALELSQPSGTILSACTVTPEGPDFWYVPTPPKLAPISAGGSTSFTTMAVPFGGFSGPINLTVDGVKEIPGANSSWDTQTINTSGNATLTVNTSSTTPTGVYPITMVANNGAITRTLTTSVLVNTVLAVAPGVANLGSIGVGSTTAHFPVTLADLGTNGVSISSITTTGDFTQTNTCGTQVGGTNKFNYQCSISVYFTPTKVGTRTGTLTIVDADAGSPQKVTLTGVGIGVPITSFTPSSLTFASTDVGYSSAAQTITVTNSGTGNLDITSISLSGVHPEAFQETNGCPTSLSPAGSCKITVTFIPTFSGTINATVSVLDSASTLAQTVALTGVGVNPSVSLTPVSLAFGSQQVGTSSAVQKITLQNTGTGPLYLSSIVVGGTNPQDYSESDNCPTGSGGLNPSASCVLSVTFTPTASGSRVATITVTDNAKNSPQTAYLNGNGTNFTVTLTPASMTFGNQVVGTQSTAKTATLTNKGTTTLNITTVGFAGNNGGDFLQTNTCGKSVPPSGTCTISVTFAPLGTGTRTATLQVNDNGYQSPQSVSITGTAVQPAVLLSPTSLSFTVQQINTSSKSQKITVTNTGTGSLTISAIAVGGANQSDFTQTNGCPISGLLGVGNSCYITVTFTPKAAGTRTASISISDNAPGAPHVVALTGIGTAVTVTPSSLNFGVITVGRSGKAKTVTVTNLGSTSLTINGITLSGANAGDFSQTNTCGSGLAGGATCTVTVTFTPTAVGARAATLNVNDSDPAGPQTVSLTGTGI